MPPPQPAWAAAGAKVQMDEGRKRIHFISVGGGVMHALALHLHGQGHWVTGSDDVIYSPSRELLAARGLLPQEMGWAADRISAQTDWVLVGMHAKGDNPELLRAQELGVPCYDYPTFVAEKYARDKQRVVITGSHGKTTTTAMVMHILKTLNYPFDYLVGASVPGFDMNVHLSDAPVVVIEGDEYPSSPTNLAPKFTEYKHHVGLITGLAWDHMNYYPTFEDYLKCFENFVRQTPKGGSLVFNQTEAGVKKLCEKVPEDIRVLPYELPKHEIKKGVTFIKGEKKLHPLRVFGQHNLLNASGAQKLCEEFCISADESYEALGSFEGVERRLSRVGTTPVLFWDFAHAPTKVCASTRAVKAQFPNKKLAVVLELHTFSSLNKDFLPLYAHSLDKADLALVFVDPKVLRLRAENFFSEDLLRTLFKRPDLCFVTDAQDILSVLRARTRSQVWSYLFMSSGHFGGLTSEEVGEVLARQTAC